MDCVQVIICAQPTLSWDAIHNSTKIKLELFSDPDMDIFFEKGMRDGDIVKPKNKYLKSYDPKRG